MGTFFSTRTRDRRPKVWVAAGTVVAVLAGCSGQATAESGQPNETGVHIDTTSAPENPGRDTAADNEPDPPDADTYSGETATSGFCADVDGIGEELLVANYTNDGSSDPQGFVDTVAAGAQRFASVEPPTAIAGSWAVVADFFSTTHSHLDGVDVTQPNAVKDALTFDSDEPDAFAMVIQTPGHSDMVALFVQQECGVDLGVDPPPLANVCDAIDASHLETAFDGAVPSGDNRPWSDGVVECIWSGADELGSPIEVGVVVGPLPAVLPDLLQGQEPLEVEELAGTTIDMFDGALGPLRSAEGVTTATDDGRTAVLVSVATTDTATARSTAIALVDVAMRAVSEG